MLIPTVEWPFLSSACPTRKYLKCNELPGRATRGAHHTPRDFKSPASASSAIPARIGRRYHRLRGRSSVKGISFTASQPRRMSAMACVRNAYHWSSSPMSAAASLNLRNAPRPPEKAR